MTTTTTERKPLVIYKEWNGLKKGDPCHVPGGGFQEYKFMGATYNPNNENLWVTVYAISWVVINKNREKIGMFRSFDPDRVESLSAKKLHALRPEPTDGVIIDADFSLDDEDPEEAPDTYQSATDLMEEDHWLKKVRKEKKPRGRPASGGFQIADDFVL